MTTAYLPTLKQLQYLVALHEHGHFGKAADACFVSQSTLSSGIRELETLLGVQLAERSRRAVRFTALGEEVVRKAREVLRQAEGLTELVQAAGKPLSGILRLSVIPTIAPFLLPAALPRLRQRYGELDLRLREETSHQALDALSFGRADCVLLALPYGIGEIDKIVIGEDRLYVAFPREQADAIAREVTPGMIDESRLLLLEDGHCLRDHVLAACNRPDIRAEASMIGTSLYTLVQLVENGLGLTMLPEMAIRAGILEGTSVEARALRAPNASRQIALVWRRNSPRQRDFELLGEEFRQAFASNHGRNR